MQTKRKSVVSIIRHKNESIIQTGGKQTLNHKKKENVKTRQKKTPEERGAGRTPGKKKCSRTTQIGIVCGVAVLTAGAILTAALSSKTRAEAKAIDFHDNEAMRVMDTPVSMGEYMLYSVDIRTEYENTMGTDFYGKTGTNAKGQEETYENIIKEEIAESIRMVKVLCRAAEPEFGITLSRDEEETVKNNADSYYESLIDGGVDMDFLTKPVTEKFIREQYLSQKVYVKLNEQYKEDNTQAVDVGNESDAEAATAVSEVPEELTDAIAELEKKYDNSYDFETNINWELMDAYSFAEEGKELGDEQIHNAINQLTGSDNTEVFKD